MKKVQYDSIGGRKSLPKELWTRYEAAAAGGGPTMSKKSKVQESGGPGHRCLNSAPVEEIWFGGGTHRPKVRMLADADNIQ